MSEEQILEAIENSCQDNSLIFQIIILNAELHIYINRETEKYINYEELKNKIVSAISSLNLNLEQIYLYSRKLGETEPDWQATIEYKNNDVDKNLSLVNTKTQLKARDFTSNYNSLDFFQPQENNIIEKLKNIKSEHKSPEKQQTANINNLGSLNELQSSNQKQLDLASYCFIRNKLLLTSDLVAPKENIARLIKSFHLFNLSIKENQLPILANYFSKSHNPDLTNLSHEEKIWWDEILNLSSEEYRKIAIWLSRYCFNPEETYSSIEAVLIAKASIEKSEKQHNSDLEESLDNSSVENQTLQNSSNILDYDEPKNCVNAIKRNKNKSQFSSSSKLNLWLTIAWIAITFGLVITDINKFSNAAAVCDNLSGESKEYCLLAGEIVGEQNLDNTIQNLPEPLPEYEHLIPEYIMEKGLANCEIYGNIAAGIPLKEARSFKKPLLSKSVTEILPDFYVADVEQTNFKEGTSSVRTACFFYRVKKLAKKYDLKFLAMDRIDTEWPEVAYEPTEKVKSLHSLNKTLRTYSFFSIFGINTFFTAIAIYLVAISGMAIKVNSLDTIYQASFILGMIKSIISFLPLIGFFIAIPVECAALGITSVCVKGFKIDWNFGYPFVAATAMILIGARSLLSVSFLNLLYVIFAN